MSYHAEKVAVDTYFGTNWIYTPIVYQNGESLEDDEWVRLSIQHGDANRVSLGDNPGFRFWGVVYVQIYVKKDSGSGRALQLADYVDGLFRELVLDTLRFKVPQVVAGPIVGEHYVVTVSTEFYRGS